MRATGQRTANRQAPVNPPADSWLVGRTTAQCPCLDQSSESTTVVWVRHSQKMREWIRRTRPAALLQHFAALLVLPPSLGPATETELRWLPSTGRFAHRLQVADVLAIVHRQQYRPALTFRKTASAIH